MSWCSWDKSHHGNNFLFQTPSRSTWWPSSRSQSTTWRSTAQVRQPLASCLLCDAAVEAGRCDCPHLCAQGRWTWRSRSTWWSAPSAPPPCCCPGETTWRRPTRATSWTSAWRTGEGTKYKRSVTEPFKCGRLQAETGFRDGSDELCSLSRFLTV